MINRWLTSVFSKWGMTLYTSPGQIKIIGTRNFHVKIYSVEDGHKLVGKRVGLLCVFYNSRAWECT